MTDPVQFAIPSAVTSVPMPDAGAENYGNIQNYLFGRSYQFVIGSGADALAYTDVKMTFEIEKTSESTSNKAKIELYNCNFPKNLKGLQIELRVGYGSDMIALFIGVAGAATHISRRRSGADIITSIELGDGEKSLYHSYTNKKWPKKTPILLVFNELLTALGVPVFVDPSAKILLSESLDSCFVVSGSVKAALDILARKMGLKWTICDGRASVWKDGSGFSTITAIKVDKFTGMIGMPSIGSAGDGVTTFTSLLNPKIKPGMYVKIESIDVNGVFTVQKATYSGDTHASKWQVTCECKPAKNYVVSE